MQYLARTIEKQIHELLWQGRILILYGPRRSGKTTLVKQIISQAESAKYLLCERPDINDTLKSQNLDQILRLFADSKLVVLDEAQSVKDIGRVLKLLIDLHPEIQIIATGSSSLDLANEVVEPLTGRKFELYLYPFSVKEIADSGAQVSLISELENLIIYGGYPAVRLATKQTKKLVIDELAKSYLFKDILAYQDVRNSDVLYKLLQMLAFQIGSEVSVLELSNGLGIAKDTVERYIDLLEQTFVIHRLTPFSRNLRKELKKMRKIYFHDLGIRNALIGNFNQLDLRYDKGALWENFLINERLKHQRNNEMILPNRYFWRTYDQKEIDLVEQRDGKISGYEFKWSPQKKHKPPADFLNAYENSNYELITPENYLDFVT